MQPRYSPDEDARLKEIERRIQQLHVDVQRLWRLQGTQSTKHGDGIPYAGPAITQQSTGGSGTVQSEAASGLSPIEFSGLSYWFPLTGGTPATAGTNTGGTQYSGTPLSGTPVNTGGTPDTGGTLPGTGGTEHSGTPVNTGGTPDTGGTEHSGTPVNTGGTPDTGGTPTSGGTAHSGTPTTGGTAHAGTAAYTAGSGTDDAPIILRPMQDGSPDSEWGASTGSSKFACVDEETADDADFMNCLLSTYSDLSLNLTDPDGGFVPSVDSGHILRVRARITGGTIAPGGLTVILRQGTTVIESNTTGMAVNTSWQTFTWTLNSVNVATISDYTNLNLRCQNDGAGSGGDMEVSWMELEIPNY